MSVGELNKRLKNLPLSEAKRIKQLRRTLKNRGYAAICRGKRVEQVNSLENQKQILIQRIQLIKKQTAEYLREHKELTEKYNTMKKLADDKNIQFKSTMQVVPSSNE